MVALNGPGASDNGTTEWSLSAATGADNCTFSVRALWYARPIANSPYATRLQSAGITCGRDHLHTNPGGKLSPLAVKSGEPVAGALELLLAPLFPFRPIMDHACTRTGGVARGYA